MNLNAQNSEKSHRPGRFQDRRRMRRHASQRRSRGHRAEVLYHNTRRSLDRLLPAHSSSRGA
eukprot:3339806-Pleurochrysis_carterae.AAC.1